MQVKLAVFVVLMAFASQALAAQQLFGFGEPVSVVRLSLASDDDSMSGSIIVSGDMPDMPDLFSMSNAAPSPSPFFGPDLFSSLFRNLFDDAPMMMGADEQQQQQQEEEEGPTVIRVSITTTSSEQEEQQPEQQEEDENPMARFSTVFQRMASMIEDMRSRAMTQISMNDQSSEGAPVRRNCALLRACADEIDQMCSSERLTNIAGAISMCLSNHREELGDQCRAVLDKRMGAGDDAEDEEADPQQQQQQQQQEDEGDMNSSVVIVPIEDGQEEQPQQPQQPEMPAAELEQPADEAAEPEEPLPPTEAAPAPAPSSDDSERPCKNDVDTFCATEKANIAQTHLVGVMACLHRHQSQLSAQCLAALDPTAAFHCAEDAETLCPGVHGRQNIARCLHQQADKVSDECKQAARKHTTASKMRFATQQVEEAAPATDAAAPAAAVAPAPEREYRAAGSQAVEQEVPSHVWPLAVAGGCFVLIVSLAAVIVYRRRRQQQQELPITITLGNPSQSSATLSAEPVPYSPRVQERL